MHSYIFPISRQHMEKPNINLLSGGDNLVVILLLSWNDISSNNCFWRNDNDVPVGSQKKNQTLPSLEKLLVDEEKNFPEFPNDNQYSSEDLRRLSRVWEEQIQQ